MDEDIAKWIIEYLLRQSIDEKIINGVISILPLTNTDNRLTKSLLLRRIEFEITNGSISEKILDFLEIIEELDHREGTSVSMSMKLAYCAVAVDITVRFLDSDIENNEKYLETVRKVWIDRVQLIESFTSEESSRWMSEIEESVKDLKVRERILKRNTRNEALKAVRVYLKEAWGCIGPTFLELVAKKFGNGNGGGSGGGGGGGCAVVEDNPCRDLVPYRGTLKGQMAQPTRSKHNITKSKHHRERIEDESMNETKRHSGDEPNEDESLNKSKRHSGDEPNEDESLNKSKRRRVDEGNEDEPMNKRKRCRGHEENEHESINILKTAPTPEPDKLETPNSTEHNASVGKCHYLPDALQTPQNLSTVAETNNIGNDAVVVNPTKPDLTATPEVDAIQKAPKSNTMVDLSAFVRDHLPDALHMAAQTLTSTMATNNYLFRQKASSLKARLARRPSRTRCILLASLSGNKTVKLNRTTAENDEHGGKNNSPVSATKRIDMKRRSSIRRSLMEPNGSSHTKEWNDSIDNSLGQSPCRPRIATPRKSKPDPRKSYDGIAKINKRRERKYWSAEEEEKLRDGVEKFGKGNWKLILHCYREIFQDRTEIDLKDKWRNMTRAS